MASITIRRLDDQLKAKLKIRAASHGKSMEAEAREILSATLRDTAVQSINLAESIRRYVEPFGGVDLKLPPRQAVRRAPTFSK